MVSGTERGGAVVPRRRKVERLPRDCWCGKQCIGGPGTVACRKGYASYVSVRVGRSEGSRRIPALPAAMLARYFPLSPKPMLLPIGARRSVRIVGSSCAGTLGGAPLIGNSRETVRAMQSGNRMARRGRTTQPHDARLGRGSRGSMARPEDHSSCVIRPSRLGRATRRFFAADGGPGEPKTTCRRCALGRVRRIPLIYFQYSESPSPERHRSVTGAWPTSEGCGNFGSRGAT